MSFVLPRLSGMGVSQGQVSSLANAHGTWTNELANTNNTAAIDNSFAANPGAVTGFDPSNYTVPSSVLQVLQAWCPLFTEELLMQQVQSIQPGYAQTLISQGIGPQLQTILQGLQALATQAGTGNVLLHRSGHGAAAHLRTAEYRSGSGQADLREVIRMGPVWGVTAEIFALAGAVAMITGVGEAVLCVWAGYEVTLAAALAISSIFCGIVSNFDDEMGW